MTPIAPGAAPTAPSYEIHPGTALVVLLDLQWRVSHTNTAFNVAFGAHPQELQGMHIDELRHHETPRTLFDQLRQVVEYGALWTASVKFVRRDGGWFWALATAVRVVDRSGGMRTVVVLVRPSTRDVRSAHALYASMRGRTAAWLDKLLVCPVELGEVVPW